MCRGELSAVIAQLMFVCEVGGSGRKELEMAFPFPCCPANGECHVKGKPR